MINSGETKCFPARSKKFKKYLNSKMLKRQNSTELTFNITNNNNDDDDDNITSALFFK